MGRDVTAWVSRILCVATLCCVAPLARADDSKDPPPPPPPDPIVAPEDAAPEDAAAKDAVPKRAALDEPAPPAPPPPPASPAANPPSASPPPSPTNGTAAPTGEEPLPAPTEPIRERPPEPPPAEWAPGWDVHHRDRSVPLPPPLPPPDPFAPRPIPFRIDREVSADGRIKEVRRVPQWVDVLERRDIEEMRPYDLHDLLRRFPNVMFADGGSPFLAMPVIRGLGGDRVKIMTDGVWPSTQPLGVAGGTLSLWDPESTQRVEVYHGPGAYLRGAEAGGGVINVVPRRPWRHECFEPQVSFASAFRSGDTRFRERAEFEAGQGHVAALGGVTWTTSENRDTGGGTLDPSSFDSVAADLAVDYFLDNQSTVGFTGQWLRARDIRSPLGGGTLFTQPEYERLFLGLTLSSVQIGPVFHGARMSLAFDTFLQDDDQDTQLSLTDGISSTDKVKRWDFHLQGNLYLLPCHDTWAELTVAYAHLKRTEAILCNDLGNRDLFARLGVHPQAEPGTCVDGVAEFEAEELRVKGLIEDETHSECWDVHVGARVDLIWIDDTRTGDSDFDLVWGVAGGAARHLTDCLSLYGNASFGWRHPSIHELFSIAVLDGVTVFGNPDLNDELAWNLEFGLKSSVYDWTSLQAAVFAHGLYDYVGRKEVLNDEQWDNIGDTILYGCEVSGAWRPAPCCCEGLELFGAAGVTLSTDDDVIHDFPVHGRVGSRLSTCVEGPCGLRRWYVEGSLRGAEESRHDGMGGGAFVTADVSAGIGWARGNGRTFTANVGVTNLFDEDYTEPLGTLRAMGRSVFLSLSIDF